MNDGYTTASAGQLCPFNEAEAKMIRNWFPRQSFSAVGIDGCKGQWLAVSISHEGYALRMFESIAEACGFFEQAASILLDMPIGLPEGPGDMRPEPELRKRLKGKASSVFNAPCRQATYATDYAKASQINEVILGKKLSRQSYGILAKIREVDGFLEAQPHWKNRLVESHPEYAFSLLKGSPILANKRRPEGSLARIELLSRFFPCEAVMRSFVASYPAMRSKTDDLLDALVLAIIGGIGLKDGFHSIPLNPSIDARGIRMQIIGADLKLAAETE